MTQIYNKNTTKSNLAHTVLYSFPVIPDMIGMTHCKNSMLEIQHTVYLPINWECQVVIKCLRLRAVSTHSDAIGLSPLNVVRLFQYNREPQGRSALQIKRKIDPVLSMHLEALLIVPSIGFSPSVALGISWYIGMVTMFTRFFSLCHRLKCLSGCGS